MTQNQGPFGALAGLKVVDLARVLGGPYCTQILADHGADVIKVEPPQGDEVRDWGPPFHEGDASYFTGLNRNKRSIGLDLKIPEGREVLLRLLEEADVLIENYKTGTMEKWGLSYDDVLAKRFPRLIHCRISGYGADGPLGGFPGYDAIVQAMTGWFSINGGADKVPTRVGIAAVDMGTGLYSCVGILMALFERQKSGRGQYIDMTLYDCAISLMHPHIPNYYLSGGEVPGITGNQHSNIAPYDKFSTKTVDVFIGAGNNRAFQRLCDVLGRPEL
ncbi:MAG TPA: carnitine dehydratase, partial [Rhodospirillaceae bacterium]|nr:carnitine dehydratase [Rhodospirillaceae bacterium]